MTDIEPHGIWQSNIHRIIVVVCSTDLLEVRW